MIRTIASGWAAAIVATLIAADLPAQEPQAGGRRRFRGGHQRGTGRVDRIGRGRTSSATSTK